MSPPLDDAVHSAANSAALDGLVVRLPEGQH
jgi:hypothetical protein